MGAEIDETKVLHVIPDSHIVTHNVGKSDERYYNFISILPWIYSANANLMPLVIKSALRVDISAIRNRGVRPLQVKSQYLDSMEEVSSVSFDNYDKFIREGTFNNELVRARVPLSQLESTVSQTQQSRGRTVQIANEWASAMWRWYSQLDRYQNGHIVIKGNPSIRVGHIVALPSETRKIFDEPHCLYVLSVSHDYEVDQGRYLTTLVLGRGQPAEPSKFIRPVTDGRVDVQDLDVEKRSGRLVNRKVLKREPFSNVSTEITVELLNRNLVIR
jgi:hypothetical protein